MAFFDWHGDQREAVGFATYDRNPSADDVDVQAVRAYRIGRVRAEMAARNIDACILSDAVNIRYATDTRNMQVFTARNEASRYLLLTAKDAILYEFTGCMHLADGIETITEVRPAITASFVAAGDKIAEREKAWAAAMASDLTALVGPKATVGMERLNAGAIIALGAAGFNLVDAQEPLERARAIKSDEELKCVRASLRATEAGMASLRTAIRPGITENQLWSVMHQAVIAQNGDYCETRLLNSGNRTNPWFQESSPKVIGENELIAFDTDVVGCFGYYSDFSRTFHAGPGKPSQAQIDLYKTAHEQVHYNMGILYPGMSFKEYADAAWNIPEKYHANRYYLSSHGVGMTGEYPYLYHHADYADAGYDGILEPGMTICMESYIGEENGPEGVKLEQQVLITETGIELLSEFPFEVDLLR